MNKLIKPSFLLQLVRAGFLSFVSERVLTNTGPSVLEKKKLLVQKMVLYCICLFSLPALLRYNWHISLGAIWYKYLMWNDSTIWLVTFTTSNNYNFYICLLIVIIIDNAYWSFLLRAYVSYWGMHYSYQTHFTKRGIWGTEKLSDLSNWPTIIKTNISDFKFCWPSPLIFSKYLLRTY